MKLPFKWLADFVDLSGLTPEIVAEKLTMNAFEVEGIHTVGPDITGPVVVGEIVEIQAHPDPKVTKMRLTKVKVDEKEAPLEIVCGASNIAVGQRVPVALPGSIVVNRHDGTAFPISVTEKRGVKSNGMLCAPGELGITDGDAEGILILDPKIANKLGSNIIDLLCLEKDSVLTVGSRSNRGDAVCIRGMAREVAALFERPLREPEWQLPDKIENTKYNFSVEIENVKDCDYFAIRSLSNIKIAASPAFIVRRLAAVGTRSINNIVDITNYVMHEWGQPMHAYDARAVKDGKFIIRRGKKGEKYTTLDGKERIINEEILIIADPEKTIGMPIMGGANSEINDSTTDIALEAASFSPALVRRASRLLGLSSESTVRFERGIDAATTKQASDRAAWLIAKYCGNNGPVKIGAYTFGGSDKYTPAQVELRLSEIKRYLNLDLKTGEVKDLLSKLGFTATEDKKEKLVFSIPSFRRTDVRREIDLIEEVCRMYGYNNIEEETPAFLALAKMPDKTNTIIRQALAAQGLCEAFISSLVSDQPSIQHPNLTIKVLNPLSPEHQVLRQSLLPGLINALKYNNDRSEKDVWLFELGYVYHKHESKEKLSRPANEELKVAGILSGNRQLSLWQAKDDNYSVPKLDFYTVKGMLENLFDALSIPLEQVQYITQERIPPFMHPGQTTSTVSGNNNIGWLGLLHPAQALEMGLDPLTFLFELDVESLKKLRSGKTFTSIPTQPAVTRDLTIDLPYSTGNIAITNCIQENANYLKQLNLVSIYPLNNELKSFSYRLTFQSEEETFKSEEIEQIMNNIRSKLKEKLSASFRG